MKKKFPGEDPRTPRLRLSTTPKEGGWYATVHDTRAPFWTGIGTGSRARQVQDPNGGSRFSFRFWPHKKTIPSSSLSFLAAKKTLYLHPFSVVRTSAQSIKTKQQSAPKNWSSQTFRPRPVNLKLEVAWPWTWALARRIRVGGSTDERL